MASAAGGGSAQPAPSPLHGKALQMAVWIPGRHPGGAGREQLMPYISYGKLGTKPCTTTFHCAHCSITI